MSTFTISTLADCALKFARCCGCIEDLPGSAPAEAYLTPSNVWVVVTCPSCHRCTPFRLEEI